MISGGFTFISEILKIDGEELELTDGLMIRKATAEEIKVFKKLLPLGGLLESLLFRVNYFEIEWEPNDGGGFYWQNN